MWTCGHSKVTSIFPTCILWTESWELDPLLVVFAGVFRWEASLLINLLSFHVSRLRRLSCEIYIRFLFRQDGELSSGLVILHWLSLFLFWLKLLFLHFFSPRNAAGLSNWFALVLASSWSHFSGFCFALRLSLLFRLLGFASLILVSIALHWGSGLRSLRDASSSKRGWLFCSNPVRSFRWHSHWVLWRRHLIAWLRQFCHRLSMLSPVFHVVRRACHLIYFLNNNFVSNVLVLFWV